MAPEHAFWKPRRSLKHRLFCVFSNHPNLGVLGESPGRDYLRIVSTAGLAYATETIDVMRDPGGCTEGGQVEVKVQRA